MSTNMIMDELRKLSREELEREIEQRRLDIAKMRLMIRLQKEKDTARLRRERRTLARISMVLQERIL
mgnify:CR=1 FL=1